MGGAAADAIVEEREKNGPYKDIYDFAERIDFTRVNRKAFESLAYSGGFDSFGLQREQYFGENGKGGNFLDTLVHYGQEFQREKREQMNSLFGGDDVEIKHPVPPKVEKWPVIEKLNKERSLVGIYLSAHPLDEYRVILENMCNINCNGIGRDADKQELAKLDKLTFGGIVTNVTERFSQKTGKPFGFVTIEDFDSSGEIGIFGDDWARWNGMLKKDYSVFITAKCVPRFRDSNVYNINIENVEQLYDVKAKRLEKFTITLDPKQIDATMVTDLAEVIDSLPWKYAAVL